MNIKQKALDSPDVTGKLVATTVSHISARISFQLAADVMLSKKIAKTRERGQKWLSKKAMASFFLLFYRVCNKFWDFC